MSRILCHCCKGGGEETLVTTDPLVLTNVAACTMIVIRLMMFRKPGGKHNVWASWLAYVIILAYASVPFRFMFDFLFPRPLGDRHVESHHLRCSVQSAGQRGAPV